MARLAMDIQWSHKVFNLAKNDFAAAALDIFRFQHRHNDLYHQFCEALRVRVSAVKTVAQIPFLPIRFFKSHQVMTGSFEPAIVFESSGTTGAINSRHFVKDLSLYEQSFLEGFNLFYGDIKSYCIIGLLPSYLERQHASLVYMVNELISRSHHPQSGFYLNEWDALASVLEKLEQQSQKTILIGVSFALLDFAEKYPIPLQHTIVMETGGMKGRREELLKQQLHDKLQKAFGLPVIHSEYGMTELLSQAYSSGAGIFRCPPWMKVLLRDEEDPLQVGTARGAINIIDLANIHSCCFIATDDAGRLHADGSFEVMGRLDNSDIRGCSLMAV